MSYTETAIDFDCDGDNLIGVISVPDNPVSSTGIVIAVGGPQYRVGAHRMFVSMARSFAISGFTTLRFDFRGMGDSEGDFPGFEALASDLQAAVRAIKASEHAIERCVLLGLCDGASAAVLSCNEIRDVCGLVLLNPYVHTDSIEARTRVKHYYGRRLASPAFWRALLTGRTNVRKAISEFLSKLRSLLDRAVGQNEDYVSRMATSLGKFNGAILTVLSENDHTAKEFAETLASDAAWKALQSRLSVTRLAGADHTLSDRRDLEAFQSQVIAWLVNKQA